MVGGKQRKQKEQKSNVIFSRDRDRSYGTNLMPVLLLETFAFEHGVDLMIMAM